MYDLAVNGGGLLTVHLEKNGYLTSHRKLNVPWQNYAILPAGYAPFSPGCYSRNGFPGCFLTAYQFSECSSNGIYCRAIRTRGDARGTSTQQRLYILC